MVRSALPVITAPSLAADTVIAVDASCFASALGPPDFSTDENPVLHMDTVPLAIGTAGSPPAVAAPTQSLWQTASPNSPPSTAVLKDQAKIRPHAGGVLTKVKITAKNWLGRLRVEITHIRKL